MSDDMLLEVRDVSKSFPGVQALRNVNLEIHQNEVVAFVGENGAGKSTLLNILSGLFRPDSGEIIYKGASYEPANYHDATLTGISRVFQEQGLVPNIPVYENLFISHEKRFTRLGVLSRRRMNHLAGEVLADAGLDVKPTDITGTLPFPVRQMLEVIRAFAVPTFLGVEHPLVLLDEPTAGLDANETELLYARLRRFREHGSAVLVSHALFEALELCDRIYVFKDGEIVDMVFPKDVNESRLHELMVGRQRDREYYKEDCQRAQGDRVVLEVSSGCARGCFHDVSLRLHEGEILGIGGMLGSGKSELGRVLAGDLRMDSGELSVFGATIRHPTVRKMLRAGVGYIPGERAIEGLILYLPVQWNMTLPIVPELTKAGYYNMGEEKRIVQKHCEMLNIKTASRETLVVNLSGGNQQKVVLAKWLAKEVKILILENPTRGMDAGVKADIYAFLRELAANNVSIVLITDELLELIGMSNSIAIMKEGMITSMIEATAEAKPTEKELVQFMV